MNDNNTSNDELISVVIPSYNRANLILKSVNSVLNQTYRNIELIVVDDGSTDNTIEVLKQVEDDRLHILRLEKNSGMCYARNAGTNIAHGTYIACHDSDDIWFETKLEKQLHFIKENDYDLVFCRMQRVHENRTETYFPSKDIIIQDDIYHQLLISNFVASITMLMKRQLCDTVKFAPEVRRYTDWDFILRVLQAGFKIGYLPETLVTSYIQSDSTSVLVNAHNSIKIIYERFQRDIDAYPPAKAKHMYALGTTVPGDDRKLTRGYLYESLKSKFTYAALLRIIFNELRVTQVARTLKRKLRK